MINLLCTVINLISYLLFRNIPLGMPFGGGEWEGRVGFGMMRNRTFPLTYEGNGITGKIWLSVEPISFIVSFIVVFIITIIIIRAISKKKGREI